MRRSAAWALALLGLPLAAGSLEAQYFGRNKVRYESFDFRILETKHYDIHYYPAESLATVDAARMAERWYTRLSELLDFHVERRPLVLYADHPDFQQTNVGGAGIIDQGTGGFTEGAKNRVVMPFTESYAGTDHVLGHEIVHVFQYAISDSLLRTPGLRARGIQSLPLWLIEGMAEYLSVGREDPHTAMWLRDAVLRDDLPTIRQLTTDSRYFPYRYGQALWAYIGGEWGDKAVGKLYREALQHDFERAIQNVLRISHDSLSKEWHAAIRDAYGPVLSRATRPAEVGARVLPNERRERGMMEISPALSPDGRYVAFLSSRNLVSIDLFVADVESGRVIASLTTPNADHHFGALSYISAAGSWSPDGKRFAFVTQDDGDNQISIFDVEREKVVRRFDVPGVGAIGDAAWGPDGRIAFSGMRGGWSDLWLLDPETGEATPLTRDRYADLQPAWSPDGRSLVFATDRGDGTSFDTLTYRPMRLARLDLTTGLVSLLPALDGAKHINPHVAPDGRDIFFIADHGGFSNVFRLSLADSTFHQVTQVATGVSGITAQSPALTVASRSGRVVFSVFDDGGGVLRRLDPHETVGTPVGVDSVRAVAGILPPADASREPLVDAYLADATTGLPDPSVFRGRDFSASRLGLEYVGSPSIGIGVGGYGPAIGGGVQAYWGDMLGDHLLGGALFGGGDIRDFGGELMYLRQKGRMSWLVGASHVPYYIGGFATVRDTVVQSGGRSVGAQVYDEAIGRIYLDQVATTALYPLSETRRLEAGVSANRQSYGVQSRSFLIIGNQVVGQLPSSSGFDTPSLSYGQASLAYVGDYSAFGFTSPISGGRFRFEASPVFGGLNMTTLLADYRRYLFLKPVTVAFRGLHYGRYGADAENEEWLSPIFLGAQSLVRGYSYESFRASECSVVAGDASACPEFDRLLGSRIAVASAEVRIPLIGPRQLALIPFRFLPVEVAPFVDAGVAWTSSERPSLTLDSGTIGRVPVFSTGVSTRLNLFGAAVLEVYYAYPFQRDAKGGHWGFSIAPGW